MKMTGQYRHWMVTVHAGHVDINIDDYEADEDGGAERLATDLISALNAHWEVLREHEDLRYAIGQVETTNSGRLHIQAYTEWKRSFRVGEVAKRWAGSYEQRNGSRDAARDYCRKKDSRVQGLDELGQWRDDPHDNHRESLRQKAVSMIAVEGLTPERIAMREPMVYFVHFRAIEALSKALGRDIDVPKIRRNIKGFGEPADDDGGTEKEGQAQDPLSAFED